MLILGFLDVSVTSQQPLGFVYGTPHSPGISTFVSRTLIGVNPWLPPDCSLPSATRPSYSAVTFAQSTHVTDKTTAARRDPSQFADHAPRENAALCFRSDAPRTPGEGCQRAD